MNEVLVTLRTGQVLTARQQWHPVMVGSTTVTHIAGTPEYLLDGEPITADEAVLLVNAELQPFANRSANLCNE